MNNRVAIVNSSSFGKIFPEHLERLKDLGEVKSFNFDSGIRGEELAKELQGYNMIIASVTPFFTKDFFENKDELKLITRHGIGYNNIDLEAAKTHNTIVSIVPPLIERDAVAENNITNLVTVMRRTNESYKYVLEDKWEERAKFIGRGLSGKTVGVIGVGNIGSRVSEILRYGFRCDVLGYDPNKNELDLEVFGARKVDFDTLLKESDIICLCASLNEANYHMISTKELEKMKDNVYISNTARGALVDEEALIKAIESKKVAGFTTDVLEVEPGRADHDYLKYDNIIVTPHTSAYTMECLEGMGEKCVADCEAVLSNQIPHYSVQSEILNGVT
ncbi:MAG: D-isomer specific 2-hydroxyacid dehydrogenase family protein [Alkalibacterium sp.]|uniref:D-isomer specific 2-hydroxyacid dehydrogenase family protein n=1 Tax=Alkalibacterium sp. TaxID=1872447 RepID=UPI003970E14F